MTDTLNVTQTSSQIPRTEIWGTLLDAVTATGAGTTQALESICKSFSCVITYATAAPTAATVKLQGSNDGTNFVDLGSTTDVSATTVGFAVADKPFGIIRGNLTAYTAGSCTGVTLKVVGINT
jgi:hypothetical protein